MFQLMSNLEVYVQSGNAFAFIAAFLGGIFVSFTPCVYPLIPVTIAVLGAQKAESKPKAFMLSLSYVAGIATTYSALGLIAALTGSLFGSIQNSPWTYFFVGNVCLAMGLSILDVFDLSFLFAFSSNARTKGALGKGYLGNLLAGMAAGLIVGPCTAPALAVLLAYVAATGRAVFGAALMFTFAIGMCCLILAAGTFGAALAWLPRADVWMLKIKKVFGLLLLALGEYFFIRGGIAWIK